MRGFVRRFPSLAATAAAWLACVAAAPAEAAVTLQLQLSSVSCQTYTAEGWVAGNCETASSSGGSVGASFAAVIERGYAAGLYATYTYHYTDDGLAVGPNPGIQTDVNGLVRPFLPVDHEAGVLTFHSNDCRPSRYCGFAPWWDVSGTQFEPPLILGLNDRPDDISGSVSLHAFIHLRPDAPVDRITPTLFVGVGRNVFAAPVPEASTFGLMALGLPMLAFLARRRRKG